MNRPLTVKESKLYKTVAYMAIMRILITS